MKRRIAASLTALLWALFTYLGFTLVSGVAQRQVPSYPNAAQWHYYVVFPLIMLLVDVGLLLLAKKIPLALLVAVLIVQIVLFIPFLLGYTGGI